MPLYNMCDHMKPFCCSYNDEPYCRKRCICACRIQSALDVRPAALSVDCCRTDAAAAAAVGDASGTAPRGETPRPVIRWIICDY